VVVTDLATVRLPRRSCAPTSCCPGGWFVAGRDRYGAPVPMDRPCLFVYGTLQPGRWRWPFLADGWPVATFDDVEATATNLLVRIVVTATAGAPAWTYHCARPERGMIRIARRDRLDER
jgi:gamma-glutamylcyclotransferase (GGCT)/AIG2-like uncharacterized protein YtfP